MADGGGGPPAAAAALKDQGNEQFKSGSYLKAAALYTQAIKLDPDNATLYRFGSVFLLLSPIGTLAPDLGPSQ
jgi:tetratricopeptide (TPR) repeat protein